MCLELGSEVHFVRLNSNFRFECSGSTLVRTPGLLSFIGTVSCYAEGVVYQENETKKIRAQKHKTICLPKPCLLLLNQRITDEIIGAAGILADFADLNIALYLSLQKYGSVNNHEI